LGDRLADALKVYEALFKLISFIKEITYFSPGHEIDIREARARCCRCVYETSDADKRLEKFAAAMEIDIFSNNNQNDYGEDYPMM